MGPRGDLEGQFNGPGGPSWGGRNVLELDSSNDVLLDTVDSVDVPDTVVEFYINALMYYVFSFLALLFSCFLL